MSLFAALMGDVDEDPFMGGHMRRMNTMMNSFFRDPFADMMGRSMGGELMPFGAVPPRGGRGQEMVPFGANFGMGFPMMPMGFPNLRSVFQDMGNNPNCHSFTSSTIMTMTPGPDGRPQVYQASQSVKQGPGGVKETKKTVADSRSGVKKMAIGHHINDRAHIIEREQNIYSGEAEEHQDFINLDEEEAEDFNREWQEKASRMRRPNHHAVEYGRSSRRRAPREPQLALPSTAPVTSHNLPRSYTGRNTPRSRPIHHPTTSRIPALSPSGAEEDEVQSTSSGGGEKRKVITEVLSSDSEQDEPQPKKLMKSYSDDEIHPSSSESK